MSTLSISIQSMKWCRCTARLRELANRVSEKAVNVVRRYLFEPVADVVMARLEHDLERKVGLPVNFVKCHGSDIDIEFGSPRERCRFDS